MHLCEMDVSEQHIRSSYSANGANVAKCRATIPAGFTISRNSMQRKVWSDEHENAHWRRCNASHHEDRTDLYPRGALRCGEKDLTRG